jgi:DNA replication and repair protein RecF
LTVVHGPNGVGKSNLLEALYFGCTAFSPRTHNERELVRFGEQAMRVVVQLSDGSHAHELSVGYGALSGGARAVKRMTADGASVERLVDVEERPLVSVFLPDRLELVKGGPALRRAHLDQLVAAIWPAQRRRAPGVRPRACATKRLARPDSLRPRLTRKRSRVGP